jgi:hypothetical protein
MRYIQNQCFREHSEQDHLMVVSAGDQQEPRPVEA